MNNMNKGLGLTPPYRINSLRNDLMFNRSEDLNNWRLNKGTDTNQIATWGDVFDTNPDIWTKYTGMIIINHVSATECVRYDKVSRVVKGEIVVGGTDGVNYKYDKNKVGANNIQLIVISDLNNPYVDNQLVKYSDLFIPTSTTLPTVNFLATCSNMGTSLSGSTTIKVKNLSTSDLMVLIKCTMINVSLSGTTSGSVSTNSSKSFTFDYSWKDPGTGVRPVSISVSVTGTAPGYKSSSKSVMIYNTL